MRLEGKTALITGAARGIGLETAKMMALQGAQVILNNHEEAPLKEAVAKVQALTDQETDAFVADVGDEAQVRAMFDHVMRRFGKIDILVNNAAIGDPKPFLLYDDAWWHEMLRVNLHSIYYTSHRAVREMIKTGRKGSIVNLSSIGATKPHRQMLAYDTCKGAIESFTRALALEMAPWEIRVNAISPASILGYFVKPVDPKIAAAKDPKDFQTPLPRQGKPEEVGHLAVFLASDESSYITGQVIAVDGGLGVQARPYSAASLQITPQNVDQFDF